MSNAMKEKQKNQIIEDLATIAAMSQAIKMKGDPTQVVNVLIANMELSKELLPEQFDTWEDAKIAAINTFKWGLKELEG
jgi:hypothetical protein